MELMHYGIKRRSGRYPWGSGDDPYQHEKGWLGHVKDLRSQGLTDKEIAQGMGMTTTEFRARQSIAKAEQRAADAAEALRLKNKGMSNSEIGRRMGKNESTIRSLLDPALQVRATTTQNTADMLKENVERLRYIDIGKGVENYVGVSRTKLNTAVSLLEDEGYKVQYLKVEQVGNPGKFTTVKVLTSSDVTYSELYKNRDKVSMIDSKTNDRGETFMTKLGLEPPVSIDSKRVMIRYNEEGGVEKDGVIELRRGVEDISLGKSHYAQVRIAVDGTHYLKGMAMYTDDLPEGVDIIFNTNKHEGTPKEKVFKELKKDKDGNIDPDNPFGAEIKAGGQRHYVDKNGEDRLSAINIVNEEGDWGEWKKSLASQMLSKQSPSLAKKQLDLAYSEMKDEYEEIMSLTNPVVKKRLLLAFADDCDASAVHLKAAALPRQASHVILPIPDMNENEVFAPKYSNGEEVILIRYPHGGTFEIPRLTVNNKQPTAKKVIGTDALDAIGINSKTAEILSGADFDGDTVLVIPTRGIKVKTSNPLEGLKDFDPKEAYPKYDGMKVISNQTKQIEMGKVSNLITDMTLQGATDDELARAVRHSMVVIDAEKHELNYKQSYVDNGIAELKEKYQGSKSGGAATLISKAKSPVYVDQRKEGYRIDPETGERIYVNTGSSYTKTTTNKNGETKTTTIIRKTETTKMDEAKDAFELSSGTTMERVYANYANDMKALGNQARKSYAEAGSMKYEPSAKKTYQKEVDSLDHKLNEALKNAPRERQAQILANTVVETKKKDNPDMDKDDLKKIKSQALAAARVRTGAKKAQVDITSSEWEAIQAGAITNNKLTDILDNTDLDRVKELATPRKINSITPAKLSRARAMLNSGYTLAEVSEQLGISTSTLTNNL